MFKKMKPEDFHAKMVAKLDKVNFDQDQDNELSDDDDDYLDRLVGGVSNLGGLKAP